MAPLAVVGVDSTGRKPELVDRLMDFAVRGTTSKAEEPVKKAAGGRANDAQCVKRMLGCNQEHMVSTYGMYIWVYGNRELGSTHMVYGLLRGYI